MSTSPYKVEVPGSPLRNFLQNTGKEAKVSKSMKWQLDFILTVQQINQLILLHYKFRG